MVTIRARNGRVFVSGHASKLVCARLSVVALMVAETPGTKMRVSKAPTPSRLSFVVNRDAVTARAAQVLRAIAETYPRQVRFVP
jgi:DNA polymerase III delta prime subunit